MSINSTAKCITISNVMCECDHGSMDVCVYDSVCKERNDHACCRGIYARVCIQNYKWEKG